MEWHSLLLLAFSLAALGLWIGGRRALTSIAPSGYWPMGWACLLLTGLLLAFRSRFPEVPFGLLAFVPSAAFVPLMVAGALQFSHRPVPRALLWAPVGIAAVRIAASLAGASTVVALVPLLVEPPLLLVAASLVQRETREASWVQRAIAPGFLALAALETADAITNLRLGTREVPWFAWIGVAIPLVALQLISQIERLRELAAQSLAEVQQSEDHLRTVLSSLGSTRVVAFDREGHVLEVYGDPVGPNNRANPYGIRRTEAHGKGPFDFLPEARAREAVEVIRDVYDRGVERQLEVELTTPLRSFSLAVNFAPVCHAGGSTDFVLGVIHDTTERVAESAELERSKNRLQAIVSALSQNRVVLLDRHGRMESIVGLIEDRVTVHGVDKSDVEGSLLTRFVPGAAGAEILEKIARVFESGIEESLFQRVELPGGEFYFEAEMRALRGPHGQPEWVLAVCTDVTERVRAEERRRELESRVRQSQKLESLGVLAGGIAHDFNNLLSGILGNADLALSDVDPESPVATALIDIRRSSVRAAELTTQLLAYAGRTSVAPAPLEVGALVSEMSALLRTSVGRGRLALEPAEKPLWIHADATQIRQLVMNLITNASESLPDLGGRVQVRIGHEWVDRDRLLSGGIAEEPTEGDYVFIEVRDDGCGMDEATQQRIFDPFFSTKIEGRGLGLAAVLGIVRSHHGLLEVRSAPGEGTTFRALFLREQRIPATTTESGAATRLPMGEGRVLVVDDDEAVRRVASRVLRKLGYEAHAAAGGPEAVEVLRMASPPFACAVVDLSMPEWDGERVGQELRAIHPDLPLIFMSGHSERDAIRRTAALDRSCFVSKPFRMSELSDAIRAVLGDVD
ncbi:MAG: ATP-binding protein [Myxococcota bacterium]